MSKYTVKDFLCNKYFAFVFTFIIFLSSCYISKIPKSYIIDYLSVGLSIFMILLYILNFKISKLSMSLLIFLACISFSTLISDTASFYVLVKDLTKGVAIAFYLDWMIKYAPQNVIKGIYYSLYVLIFINFITILVYPEGMYTSSYKYNWFLGYDNTHIFWYIPALILSLINLKIENKKYSFGSLILFLMISYSVYYCFSANSVVAYTIFILLLFTMKYTQRMKLMNAKTFFLMFVILFVLFIMLRVQNMFDWLIVGILNKDLTFTGRTIIWDNVIYYIKKRWLLGYGMEAPLVISQKLGNAHYVHAHNTILDVLYKGGIIAIIPFLAYIYMPILELYKKKYSKISKIISFAVFSLLIMMLFEARETSYGFYILFTIAYNVKILCNEFESMEMM